MRIRKPLTMAVFIAVVTAVSYGTAGAKPTPTPEQATGTTAGVGYEITRQDNTITATLDHGIFRDAENGIDVIDQTGRVIAHLPERIAVGTQDIVLTPKVSGSKLVADAHAEDIGYWRQTSPAQRSIEAGVAIGGMTGALLGGFLGVVLGLVTGGIGLIITLPVGLIGGLLGGMAIGGGIGAGIPNSTEQDQWDYVEECEYYGDYRYCW